MNLAVGTRIGSYEVMASLGAGGMGEVYKATDTRLHRTVAIKALHTLFAADPERVSRFEREAQLLASLNHPNIAAIYGVEERDREKYLVLEFVDGRTLFDVLRDGPLPVSEAMAFAKQIADGLVAAHDRGIIHRDLKPGNIMVTADGAIKILDFGLGKTLDAGPGTEDQQNSPTMTMAATRAGIILGTAGYMSPEQAKGRTADKRSDVWAFGCVLYEMLTGRRAFDGEDITETLAAIVRGEPDWAALPAGLPAPVRELVERCLIKNRTDRLSDMSVVKYLLGDRSSTTRASAAPASTVLAAPRSTWPLSVLVTTGLLAVALAVSLGALWMRGADGASSNTGGVTRVSISLPVGDQLSGTQFSPVAISPDGQTVVYSAVRSNVTQLFARHLNEAAPRPLAGTEGARSPFFSPNGRWIGFTVPGQLKKIAIDGAALQVVTTASDARGATWAPDDMIYYAPTNASSIWRVSASGGAATEVTTLDRARGEISHIWPRVTPDNATLLFTVRTGPGNDERRLVALDLKSGERHDVLPGVTTARFTTTGHLVYGRLDRLFAVPWADGHLVPGGVPIALPETPRTENEAVADYDLAANGTLIAVPGGPERMQNRIVWVNRDGTTEVLPLPERDYESVVLSPDGRQAIVQVLDGTIGLWMIDLARQTMTPFLVSGPSRQSPVWSADGKRVFYRLTRDGMRNVYMKNADGTGDEIRLTDKAGVVQSPMSVSPDGKWLSYSEGGDNSGVGVWITPAQPQTGVAPYRFAPSEPGGNGHFSPDSKWLAFQSSVSGRSEIYVRSFPEAGPRKQVSENGGSQPRWSRDGRQLYFTSLDGKIMATDVTLGASFSSGAPRVLFAQGFKSPSNTNTPYDISTTGRMIGVKQHPVANILDRIDVVINWINQLKPGAGK